MTQFKVDIKPVTQGSVTAIPVNGKARIIHNHSKELYEERALIQSLYHEAGGTKIDGAVEINIEFNFVRPKSVSVKKRPYMTVKPDLDKLVRAVLDALTHHRIIICTHIGITITEMVWQQPHSSYRLVIIGKRWLTRIEMLTVLNVPLNAH